MDASKLVELKAYGMERAIAAMDPVDQRQNPSPELTQDYNNLVDLFIKLDPAFSKHAPPKMDVHRSRESARGGYGLCFIYDIMIYCSQIREMSGLLGEK